MNRLSVGSIINGYKILKLIFVSRINSRSIYKVECLNCGKVTKLSFDELHFAKCECYKKPVKKEEDVIPKEEIVKEEPTKEKERYFDYNPFKNIGIKRGKYIVVGFLHNKEIKKISGKECKTRPYIVKCYLCGELCIMNNRDLNLYKQKKNLNVRCSHKRFFDIHDYKEEDYYLDESWKNM